MSDAGFILAGGSSSRMGQNKALLPYKNTVLVSWIARQVAIAAGSATLIGPPELYGEFDLPVVADRRRGFGPLGGIETALTVSRADWNLIVACDMPSVTAPFLGSLLGQAALEDCECLLPVGSSGLPEPLCAVWHRRSLAAIQNALNHGVRKVTAALGPLRVVRWRTDEPNWAANMNTPVEWYSHLAAISDE